MLNKGLEKSGGKLSVTDLIIKASALALMKVPGVNASWMGDTVRRFHAADISVAVQVRVTPIHPLSLLTPHSPVSPSRGRGRGRAGVSTRPAQPEVCPTAATSCTAGQLH